MLVDSTIVMLENIYRHQRQGESGSDSSIHAANEVNSAIIASTSTNLAAVLPFLFITGLVGLLFRELIFTISAAIFAAMLVALTLVPALSGRIPVGREGLLRRGINRLMEMLQNGYAWLLGHLLKLPLIFLTLTLFIGGLTATAPSFFSGSQIFLPNLDEGQISIRITADRGINVAEMNTLTERVEKIIATQPEVESIFTIVGGNVFGRSQHEAANRSSIKVLLKPRDQRMGISSQDWIKRVQKEVNKAQLAGARIRIRSIGIRGIRFNRSDDDFAIRIKGADLAVLERLADETKDRLVGIEGLRGLYHSAEGKNLELSIKVDRNRAAGYGLSVEDVGKAVRFALQGSRVTDFISGDRSIDILLRLKRDELRSPADIEQILLFSNSKPRVPVRLSDLAKVEIIPTPDSIQRDRQQRFVEIGASLTGDKTLSEVIAAADIALQDMEIPRGYNRYDAGNLETLKEGKNLSRQLLGLALFLVFVVMAVQYESLRNPLVIILSVPFAVIGVTIGLEVTQLPLSMPVWLGLIMLAGIVVNNAIVLVEYIEIKRDEACP